MLTFDPERHEYRWQGALVPNVTRILAPLVDLSMIPPDVLENARQEGIAMHKMVELDAAGDLDVDGLPDWLRPRHAAWRKFLADTGFEVIASEQQVYHPVYRYAGTLDLIGRVPSGEVWLPDLKRSFAAGAVIGLQTSAYEAAWRAVDKALKKLRRFGLRLLESGDYRLERFEQPDDFQTFLALLTVYRWREANQRKAA